MPDPVVIDLFAEDRAHEAFLTAIIRRVASEVGRSIDLRVRSAVGGHPRAFGELEIYQTSVRKGGTSVPDILIVAIDGNCMGANDAHRNIMAKLREPLADRTVAASPDPHIERWFLGDLDSFHKVVGTRPAVARRKCDRTYYKNVLAKAVKAADNPSTLGGIEYAEELVEAMDLYRASKAVPSLGRFVDEFRARLQRFGA